MVLIEQHLAIAHKKLLLHSRTRSRIIIRLLANNLQNFLALAIDFDVELILQRFFIFVANIIFLLAFGIIDIKPTIS